MFKYLLIACVVAATVHFVRAGERTSQRIGELVLLYVLVGYCGVPMLVVSLGILAVPERMATMLPVGEPGPVLAFFGWAYLGMSLLPILALKYRGAFLIAPAVCWSVYFAGATVVHLHGGSAGESISHGGMLAIFATHGLVSLVLVIALFSSGLLSNGPDHA